jgi:hypothetical protein
MINKIVNPQINFFMQKIILTFTTILFATILQAQLKVGIVAGLNHTNQRIAITEGTIYSGADVKSYHAGLTGDLSLGNNFYLQPQLIFTRKRAVHLSSIGPYDTEINISYLEIPVNLVYKFNVPFAKLYAGMGAGVSYALCAKQQQGSEKSNLFRNGSGTKREDISLNFTAGLEFNNGIFTSISSQKGLLDISAQNNTSIKNRSVSVSVGYRIDLKKLKRSV